MPTLLTRQAGGRTGGASRGCPGGWSPLGRLMTAIFVLAMPISGPSRAKSKGLRELRIGGSLIGP
eukprot:2159011-Alexandrium_andersonii.AAC.1